MMRWRTTDREALDVYDTIKRLLDWSGTDRLEIEPRLTIKRDGTVTTVVWRPYGHSETALCVVDVGDGAPCVVTWQPSGRFKNIIARCAARVTITDAELAET